MNKNILKSMFHFDRFNMEQYQKVVDSKNGLETKSKVEKEKLDWQLEVLKYVVIGFLLLFIILSINVLCFIKE